MPRQLASLPGDTTHIVVSAGGNDLLDLGRRLRGGAGNLIARFGQAAGLLNEFGQYASMCRKVGAQGLPAAVPFAILKVTGIMLAESGLIPKSLNAESATNWAWSRFRMSAECAALKPEEAAISSIREAANERDFF